MKRTLYFKFFVVSLIIALIDQATKYLFKDKSIEVIPNFFSINYLTNTGAAFGILKNYNLFLIVVSVVVIILCVKWLREKSLNYLPLSFIVGGAVGNLIDRLYFGYVRDFIDFKIWPVFNLADTFITIAVLIILFEEVKDLMFKK